jgi:hypothetical protein
MTSLEGVPQRAVMALDVHVWVPGGGRDSPLVAAVNGTLMARRFWWSWCAHGSGGCRAVPYARAWEPRIIGIDPRGMARRAPGGPLEGWPGADAGPAAPPRFHIRLDSAVDQIRAVRTPFERSRRSHRPLPYALSHRRIRVPFRRAGQSTAPRLHLPNSPRHHAGQGSGAFRTYPALSG